MYRKRRRPTPNFKIPPPYNPVHGEQANLRQDGTAPYCAMMQIAAEDTYENHVICRGFDPRILRFVDYAEGDENKPGISVAKPFGNRVVGRYQIAEVYPALLPTQGNTEFSDFRQVVYTPPSPVDVHWRLGQNPGKVTGGGLEGGQPEQLSDTIEILYDHNNKVINWLLIDTKKATAATIEGPLTALADGTGDYTGKKVGTITVVVAPCDEPSLIGESVDVVDWSGCVFDKEFADLDGVWVWAGKQIAESADEGADPGQLTPCHWTAKDRCCVDADGA